MSILQLASAKCCDRHPQERVVGVCGACLALKLTSLIHTSAPEQVDSHSPLLASSLYSSPPASINSPAHHHPLHHQQHHLLTVNEEADSSTQVTNNEGLHCCISAASSAVEVSAEPNHAGNDLVHFNPIDQVNSSISIGVPSINEEKSIVDQEISVISKLGCSINEKVPIIDEESCAIEEGISTASPQIHATESAKCERSKSVRVLIRESLNDAERAAHGHEVAASSRAETTGEQSLGAKKVTLRALFQIDDDKKRRNGTLVAADIEVGVNDQLSADGNPSKEDFPRKSIGDSKQIVEETKDVHETPHNHTHNSHGCVPSASTFSSSVCPSVPDRLKHSVLLNSLLCRKARDEKSVIKGSGSCTRNPSQVHMEAHRSRSANQDGFTQATDEGEFIRATYIASESRGHEHQVMRRCRSKLERCIAISSVSSSQSASPPYFPHVIDSKSERKFNLTARALAVEYPSIWMSSAEAEEATPPISSNIIGSFRSTDLEREETELQENQQMRPPAYIDSDEVALATGTKPAIPMVLMAEGREAEGQQVMESRPILRKRMEQDEEEYTNRPPPPPTPIVSGTPALNLPLNLQASAADTKMLAIPLKSRNGLEEAHEGDTFAGATQEEDAECLNATDGRPDLECQDATDDRPIPECRENPPIPAYIRVTESNPAGQEASAVDCRSLSCKDSSAGAGKQGSHNIPEGVWEPYSKSGKAAGFFGRSSSRHYKWPSSSRAVKVTPDQSGLLRFYLTPLRASGRTRFSSPRRPPKRHLWSLVFA